MSKIDPSIMSDSGRTARVTDGGVRFSGSISRPVAIAIIGVLAGASGSALIISSKADSKATDAKQEIAVVAKKADESAPYDVVKSLDDESVVQSAADAKWKNDLIVRVTLLERLVLRESSTKGAEDYRRKKKPVLTPVIPPPRAPLPNNPEAAAAAPGAQQ